MPHQGKVGLADAAPGGRRKQGYCATYMYRCPVERNGFTIYVGNSTWAFGNGSCGPQTLTACGPGNLVRNVQSSWWQHRRPHLPEVQQVLTKTTDTDPALTDRRAAASADPD